MKSKELTVTKPEDYAALADGEDTSELVPMPSGAVFRLRRVDVQALALMGELPLSLVTEGVNAWRERGLVSSGKTPAEPPDLDVEETVKNLIFLRQTVVDNCLEPRIGYSETGVVSMLDANGQAIAKLRKDDFIHAFRWITSQVGVEAGRLNSFLNRQERRAANAGANRKKFRGTPIVTSEAQ